MRTCLTLVLALVLLTVPIAGCLDEGEQPAQPNDTDQGPEDAVNPDPLPDEITGFTERSVIGTEGGGTGIWIDDQHEILVSANGNAGLQLFDIADPENVTKLGSIDDLYARDADVLRWDGSTYAILAGSGDGIHVVNIDDPDQPEHVVSADEHDSHNIAVVPGTPYIYDSTGVGAEGKATDPIIPVLDLTDPENHDWVTFEIPSQVNGQPTQSDGCHDVVVRQDLDKAYCAGGGSMYAAGGGETFIWDISEDPTDPEWEGIVDNPSIVYHHQAVASHEGDLLFINDEHLAPNCNGVDEGPVDVRQTTAAMWVYDISDPANPEMRSYVQLPSEDVNANCGSHFGDLIADTSYLAWGWYEGGTLLIDVSDPDDATIVDRLDPEGSTWDARYHDGHVYASSSNLQVLELLGE